MRSPLPYHDSGDYIATAMALFPIPAIDSGPVHSSIDHTITKVAPELVDRLSQGFLDSSMKMHGIGLAKLARLSDGMSLNFPENLIDVDVAKTSDDALVKQYRFYAAALPREGLMQRLRRKIRLKRL
jgi:hypothetical protein